MSDALTLDAGELAFDPAVHPELYDGVRTRRIFAFLFDAVLVFVLMAVAYVLIGVVGVLTLGLGFALLPAVWPAVAILYSTLSVGGPRNATPGMRAMGIRVASVRGEPIHYGIALLHALGFWFSLAVLTPLVLVVSLFTARKQLLHDLVLGTAMVRSAF